MNLDDEGGVGGGVARNEHYGWRVMYNIYICIYYSTYIYMHIYINTYKYVYIFKCLTTDVWTL